MRLKKEVLPPREAPPMPEDLIAAARDRRAQRAGILAFLIVGAIVGELVHFLGAFGAF